MPLDILLILVVVGIASIAVMLHLSGRSKRAYLTPDSVRVAWVRHFPDDQVTGVIAAKDGHAALVSTAAGMGLIWSFGADTVARHLSQVELDDTARGLCFKFHDFTAPSVRVALAPEERQLWRNTIQAT
ncbi:hypothetical protein [Falsiruegeria mediterranea]|jgi:hypothetical protein|uniref:Uncharacterized protein n=1 Tax=Falsiruegeria mediterranea M17 TaxID=1200281 RepID=A0A2R8C638_9RHOB|nr:hypothetical protein [Falsiruegeria mediterranea]SPJ27836.1 hypothetical protein TRM7615_01329 [Falsiruegeria mediterranea M17]